MAVTGYLIQNWALLLVLLGFAVSLISTVFLEKKVIFRMYALIAEMFLLSILVYVEFQLTGQPDIHSVRSLLMAVRYSATPLIIAQVIFTIVNPQKWYIFIPALLLTVIDFISIPTGIVFRIDDTGVMQRGPLGLLPYIMVVIYCVLLVLLMIRNSSRQSAEIIPIVYFCFAFLTGIIMPFIIGKDYAQLFCTTIAISVFIYYVFLILRVTKKDPLTGLLNRQAYYSDIANEPEEITALVSIDMNGLKSINDTEGHTAGDTAISTIAKCFRRASKRNQMVYRVGGDEFIIVCRKATEDDVAALTKRIHEYVNATRYSCSVGYSFSPDGRKPIDELLRESDADMYAKKQLYYEANKQKG